MDIVPTAYYENLKRYWRRRRYQRLNGATNNKRKMKVMKLGENGNTSTTTTTTTTTTRRFQKIRLVKKLKLKICSSPLKMLIKFHDAYINMMIRFASNLGSSNNVELFGGKRVPKGRQIAMMSCTNGEEVDPRLVFEIYKRMVSTGQLTAY